MLDIEKIILTFYNFYDVIIIIKKKKKKKKKQFSNVLIYICNIMKLF